MTPIFDSLALFYDPEPRAAAWNMAVDEELLRTATQPVLRFYEWARKAVSFGYFEKVQPVREAYPDREIVRRWTGGGVVPHGSDFTYSLVVKNGEPFMKLDAGESYRAIHGALAEALREFGFATRLAESGAGKVSSACFENPVSADIIASERKIAGAAQRRTREGLLHQGSVQIPDLPRDFGNHFAAKLCPSVHIFTPSAGLLENARELANDKYASAAWTERI